MKRKAKELEPPESITEMKGKKRECEDQHHTCTPGTFYVERSASQ